MRRQSGRVSTPGSGQAASMMDRTRFRGGRRRAAIAAAALLLAGLGRAADPPPAPGDIVNMQAEHQQWIQDQLWCGLGEVHITYQDISLRCDEIEVNLVTMHLHAQGNVVLDQADARMACDRLEFDLNQKVGTFYDVQAFFPPTYSFKGEEMEKLDATHYRFHRGLFTSCTLGDKAPPWSIEVRDAVVELEGYGHFRGASLRVKGTPVFYTPRLLWPVKRDRAAGFLVPSFGFNSTHGAYFGNSFFWPLSRSFDTTMFLDLYTKHFLGLGDEMRWAPAEHAFGEIKTSLVYDPTTKLWEWESNGKYNQIFAGGWTLHSQLQEVSDINFFEQFDRGFEITSARTLDSFGTLSRSWGPQSLNIRTEHQRNFYTSLGPPVNTQEVDLDRLGGAEYRLRATRIGLTPLYVSGVTSVDALRVDKPPGLNGSWDRFDLFPSVSIITPGFAWLSVTPTLGARETYYTAHNNSNGTQIVAGSLDRRYDTAGVSIVGPSFSRVWSLANGEKIKHLIEPRIDYSYISRSANFGLSTAPASPQDVLPYSPVPLFDEKDPIVPANQVQWTLANSLFVKTGQTGSREVLRFEISQPYSLGDPLTFARLSTDPNIQGEFPPSQKGPLSLWLRALPVASATIDGRMYIDPVTHNLQSTQLTGGLFQGTNGVNLTWYSGFDPTTGRITSSQTQVSVGLSPGASHWRIEGQVGYDIHARSLLQQQFIFKWRGSCWSVQFQYRDNRNILYPARDYRIAIDLTGLGTFLDIHGSMEPIVH